MKVDLFDFDLPRELIAQTPMRPRDAARMMLIPPEGNFCNLQIFDLADQLQSNDLLVLNNTKVIPAGLFGKRVRGKEIGTGIKVTLHKLEIENKWRAFARPSKKLVIGDQIQFSNSLEAIVREKFQNGEVILEFNCTGSTVIDELHIHGHMPLPPYIHRDNKLIASDIQDYQTIFAHREGAVAAPTAGLHFTKRIFDTLDRRGLRHAFVTLHVGAGTFLPVRAGDTKDHQMHSEWGEISNETANAINLTKKNGGRIVAVGTTTLRLLECASNKSKCVMPYSGYTDIFITPGYTFRIVDMLLTNFHLPRSTLFMLVCAFSGLDRMQQAYAHARDQAYRFYSFGDACLLDRTQTII